MGMVSRRWMWVESMGVASGCVYVFFCVYLFFFCSSILFVFKMFFACSGTFCNYILCIKSFFHFLRSINTHTGDYGHPMVAI